MTLDDARAIATAIAHANHHPDPDGYADEVIANLPAAPAPAPAPAADEQPAAA